MPMSPFFVGINSPLELVIRGIWSRTQDLSTTGLWALSKLNTCTQYNNSNEDTQQFNNKNCRHAFVQFNYFKYFLGFNNTMELDLLINGNVADYNTEAFSLISCFHLFQLLVDTLVYQINLLSICMSLTCINK